MQTALISGPLSKAQEIDSLRAWIANLPDGSYLADIMRESEPAIIDLIKNDLAWPIGANLHQIATRRLQAQTDLETVQSEYNRLQREAQLFRRQLQDAQSELEEIRAIARGILKA